MLNFFSSFGTRCFLVFLILFIHLFVFYGIKKFDQFDLLIFDKKLVRLKEDDISTDSDTDISKEANCSKYQKPIESNCKLNDQFVSSAIERAGSNECKNEIKSTFCSYQNNQLYSKDLILDDKNKCPNGIFNHLGCYLNNRRPTIINSLMFQYKRANELRCSYLCTQLDKKYFGIENSTICHCLDSLPSKEFKINDNLCNSYCDDDSKEYRCGGEYLISVYETGVALDSKQQTKSADEIRLAFLFSVNGRSIRQIKRLIKRLYSSKHFYLVHVDKQNDFLFNYLDDELSKVSNIIVTKERFYTIWGGSQLLEMILNSFKILIDYKWDYVINLSESDYPIKSLTELEGYLGRFDGSNFLKFHSQNNDAFIRKQGIEVLFLQCENRMWRLNKKRDLIQQIQFTGGSDWFVIHHTFASYLINNLVNNSTNIQTGSNHHLVNTLRKFFNYTLLPAESFFHTVLKNSKFCTKLINNNLKITNWKRKVGCRCQYKHIVDWCGCSPSVYTKQDWPKLKSTFSKPLFFARKFDPLIDHDIINQVELSYSESSADLDNFDKYWHSEFHSKYDLVLNLRLRLAKSTYTQLSRLVLKNLFANNTDHLKFAQLKYDQDTLNAIKLLNANAFFDQGSYVGTQIAFDFNHTDQFQNSYLKLDFLVSPNHLFQMYNDIESDIPVRLVSLKVCTDYDVKENVFRNFGCLIGSRSELVVQHKWINLEQLPSDCLLTFVWLDPNKRFAWINEFRLSNTDASSRNRNSNDETSLHFKTQIQTPIEVGIWTLLLIKNFKIRNNKNTSSNELFREFERSKSKLIASTKFLVQDENDEIAYEIFDKIDKADKKNNQLVHLEQLWKLKDICQLIDQNESLNLVGNSSIDKLTIKSCLNTSWSSYLPDPKSIIV